MAILQCKVYLRVFEMWTSHIATLLEVIREVLLEQEGTLGAIGTANRGVLAVLLMVTTDTQLDQHGTT